jgi:two-component system KDP operon response regulator KdpE
LSVDLVRRIVKVCDNKVDLSPKEYELLRVLVKHAGKVLTHKFLRCLMPHSGFDPGARA